MLAVGGVAPPGGKTGATEEWNGSSWAEVADLATARSNGGAAGSTTAGLFFAGNEPAKSSKTEEWSSSSIATKTVSTD